MSHNLCVSAMEIKVEGSAPTLIRCVCHLTINYQHQLTVHMASLTIWLVIKVIRMLF